MLHLAGHWDAEPVSTREVAEKEDISYQLTCKLMQRLHKAKLVRSCMGPRGGFSLSKAPSEINLLDIIGAIQGPVSLNRCVLNTDECPRQPTCPVTKELTKLQEYIETYLCGATLEDLLQGRNGKKTKSRKQTKRKSK